MIKLAIGAVAIGLASFSLGGTPPATKRVNVRFGPISQAARQIVKAALGAKELTYNPDINWSVYALPAGMTRQAAYFIASRLPGVAEVSMPVLRRAQYIPTDPDYPQQYAPKMMGMESAWNTTLGSTGIIVAVVDTGIQLNHPEFAGRLDVVSGANFVTPGNPPNDDDGHGTHCAGIIGAGISTGGGIAGISGCTLMPVKVLDASGNGYDSDISNGITFAADHGANIINLSLGGVDGSAMERDAINYAIAHGAIVAAAAGNDGEDERFYPAQDGGVLSVGACGSGRSLASYSNHGSWVSVVAPGSSILSTWIGSTWQTLSGTSMACAETSGVLAEIEAASPGSNSVQVVNALLQGSVNIGSDTAGGLINAYNSIRILQNQNAGSQTIAPTVAAVKLGWFDYGTAASMATIDQSSYTIDSTQMPNGDEQATALADFFITQPPIKVKSLSLTVCAYGYQGGLVRAYAYDFFHRRFQQIGSWSMQSGTVGTQTVQFPANLYPFIHNGEILVAINGDLPAASFIGQPPAFTFQVDQTLLNIGQ